MDAIVELSKRAIISLLAQLRWGLVRGKKKACAARRGALDSAGLKITKRGGGNPGASEAKREAREVQVKKLPCCRGESVRPCGALAPTDADSRNCPIRNVIQLTQVPQFGLS